VSLGVAVVVVDMERMERELLSDARACQCRESQISRCSREDVKLRYEHITYHPVAPSLGEGDEDEDEDEGRGRIAHS